MINPELGALSAVSNGDTLDDFDRNNPYARGAKRSWVPILGEIVWEVPNIDVPFYAYICQGSDRRQIGYVRVPDYQYNEDTANVFEELMARFESTTAAMVLDQINNPGGSMFHMYKILSALTDSALTLPKHQITIDEDLAAIASENVALAEAGEAVPPDERPSPELVAYSQFVLSELKAGRGRGPGRGRLTNPVHLSGVANIQPAKHHYTKKIVVLIDGLDFSAAEFLAAILQDNKRATLFGERTAGAGGCVKRYVPPHAQELRIAYMTYTWTIAARTNGQLIESRGVHPDVEYSLTAEDIQSGYTGYRQALLATISA